jgi:hypothetical protein
LEKVPGLDEVDYVWVERRDQLEELAAQLMKVSEFGVDTEQHSQHSFLGYTALLQVRVYPWNVVVSISVIRAFVLAGCFVNDPFRRIQRGWMHVTASLGNPVTISGVAIGGTAKGWTKGNEMKCLGDFIAQDLAGRSAIQSPVITASHFR